MDDYEDVTIDITQEDINQGVARDDGNCPVARGLERRFPHFSWSVGHETCRPYSFFIYDPIKLPAVAQRFIKSFDDGNGKKLSPFRFSLKVAKDSDLLRVGEEVKT